MSHPYSEDQPEEHPEALPPDARADEDTQAGEPLTEDGLTEELQEVTGAEMPRVDEELTRERQQGPNDSA
jgi:hypothetical protein